jgi:hypothetical protein
MEWVILTVGLAAVAAAWDYGRRLLENDLETRRFDESLLTRVKLLETKLAEVEPKATRAAQFIESQKAASAPPMRLRMGR